MAGKPFRGMVVEVSLDPVVGHEQGKTRPCVVIQNDVGNRFASTTIIVPLTDASRVKAPSPIYVPVKMGDGGTTKDSCILCDQIRVVDQSRFRQSLWRTRSRNHGQPRCRTAGEPGPARSLAQTVLVKLN
jgi:mRNA interferase MazF